MWQRLILRNIHNLLESLKHLLTVSYFLGNYTQGNSFLKTGFF